MQYMYAAYFCVLLRVLNIYLIFTNACECNVASQLLNHVLELAKKNPKVKEIYLHVQTSNTAARMFYKENFEFEEGEVISNYYKHVEPADAYILRKRFER